MNASSISSATPVEIAPVAGLRAFMEFCRVPRLVYADMKGFAPSLDAERWTLYGHKLNPHYKLVKSQRWLARRDGRTVGRIEAQVYNEFQPNEASRAQFGSLDAIDDPAVVAALTAAAENWLAAQGATTINGPYSPSINAEMGMLVEGYEAVPMIFMPWQPPYLARHLEALGYAKARDVISYRYDITAADRAAEPVIQNRGEWKTRMKFRNLRLNDLENEVRLMTDLFNDAWSQNWGFVPMTYEEFKSSADTFKFIMTEDWGFVVEIDGEAVAFGVIIPNLFETVSDLDGRIGLTGLPKLVSRLRRQDYKSGRLALFGMRRSLHRSTLAGVIILAMFEELRLRSRKIALDHIEFGWVLENNAGMRKPIEMSGAKIDKIHRIYEKQMAGVA